ncbi:MAG: lamin tail domain-containing protein [Candidatus Krumholzibacteria bacterium]|nr:lamin tail domain-containing protein [Candidatus Krumholzibacteria bacterium]
MRIMLTAIAVLALSTAAWGSSPNVRISQVYGGGGSTNPDASYNQDFVELFNFSEDTVDISGWALEYGSATGNWGSSTSNYFIFPDGTQIPPCSYLLIACGNPSSGGADLPPADFACTINASGTNGKVGLFNALNANVPCGSETPGTLVDKVAYGSANCWEGSGATGVLSITTAAVRLGGGMLDTDDNATDFVVDTPDPRSSLSPLNEECLAVSAQQINWSQLKSSFR